MNIRILLLLAALLGLSAMPVPAQPLLLRGPGAALQPIGADPPVTMDEMQVLVHLFPDHAQVEGTFTLSNHGEAATLRMGVPEWGPGEVEADTPKGFTTFAAWVDDQEVASSTTQPRKTEGATTPAWVRWRVLEVQFAANQTRSVRIRCESQLDELCAGSRYFLYRNSSAASWQGPIGSARIRLELHHGPLGGWFELVGPQFRRINTNSFQWTKRAFEPTPQDDVLIRCCNRGSGVYVGPDHIHRGGPPYPHLQGGRLWAQVRDVADWLGADVTADGPTIALTRGATVLTLRKDSKWMQKGDKQIPLPRPPRVVQGQLMLPVAAVATAFGAVPEFDHIHQTVRIILPLAYELSSLLDRVAVQMLTDPRTEEVQYVLGPSDQSLPSAAAALAALPPGWAPPDRDEYHPDLRQHFRDERHSFLPWVCVGDFNGDGFEDLAIDLRKGLLAGTAVLLGSDRHEFQLQWLSPPSRGESPTSRSRVDYLRTREPGQVSYWIPEETTLKPAHLRLECDGIERIWLGKAGVLHYWDQQRSSWERVLTGD